MANYTFKSSIGSAVRAIMVMIATHLISRGLITQEQSDVWISGSVEIVTGAVLVFLSLGWSILRNRFNRLSFLEALCADPNTPPEEITTRVKEKSEQISLKY